MYEFAYSMLPKSIRQRYTSLLRFTDIKVQHSKLTGFIFLFGFGLAFAMSFSLSVLFSLGPQIFFLSFAVSYVLSELLVYMWLSLYADSKGRFVENILPDALQLMSMNIRAGMTTDRALMLAARPEFGPLQTELSRSGKRILSGMDVRESLLEIPKNIKSDTLGRTINLIVEGIQSGGEVAELLQHTAEDIRNTKLVQQEVQSSILMYSIFIFFAAGIGSPLLFGISTFLVEVLGSQLAEFQISDAEIKGISFNRGEINVSPDFLFMFTGLSLMITSVFAALIIGIINKGDEKEGLKYIPVLIVISMFVFIVSRNFVGGIFTGL